MEAKISYSRSSTRGAAQEQEVSARGRKSDDFSSHAGFIGSRDHMLCVCCRINHSAQRGLLEMRHRSSQSSHLSRGHSPYREQPEEQQISVFALMCRRSAGDGGGVVSVSVGFPAVSLASELPDSYVCTLVSAVSHQGAMKNPLHLVSCCSLTDELVRQRQGRSNLHSS